MRTERGMWRDSPRHTLHVALRWVLGLILAATSLSKSLDVPGFHDVLRTYDLVPAWSLWFIAFVMPVIEAGIAASILIGRRVVWGAAASLLLHGSFAVILTSELLRGIHLQNCGCFGVFLARPLTWSTPLEDVFMVAITAGVLLTLPRLQRPAIRPPATVSGGAGQ